MADATEKTVKAWLDDLGVSYADGGVTGPYLDWSVSMGFGSMTHVSLAHDTEHPRRIEVMSDLAIAEDHRSAYAHLDRAAREALDRRIVQTLLRRSQLSFSMQRDAKGGIEKVLLRAYLPIEGLSPRALVGAVYDARNATMDLCVLFQEALGSGDGAPLDRAVLEEGYANVLLHQGTLETLNAFQIPGETLDETILRAVRE